VARRARSWHTRWARVGPWRGRSDIALITLAAPPPPTPAELTKCLAKLRDDGYAEVVTGALSPADTLVFVDAGFSTREKLHLLDHDMRNVPRRSITTRRARRADHDAVLTIDARAFHDFWVLDRDGLHNALDATPMTRFRVVEVDGRPAAYAITGRASDKGYLQRIAVDPDAQGTGLGSGLVADALVWLVRHGVARTLVNTQLDNDAALALYDACGFRRLPVGLCVLGRAL